MLIYIIKGKCGDVSLIGQGIESLYLKFLFIFSTLRPGQHRNSWKLHHKWRQDQIWEKLDVKYCLDLNRKPSLYWANFARNVIRLNSKRHPS